MVLAGAGDGVVVGDGVPVDAGVPVGLAVALGEVAGETVAIGDTDGEMSCAVAIPIAAIRTKDASLMLFVMSSEVETSLIGHVSKKQVEIHRLRSE